MTPRRRQTAEEDRVPYDLDEWIKAAPFRFAKTMPDNPHWYVTERDEGRRGFGAEVRAFVDHVHEQGGTRFFKGYPYKTITLDDHDYWLTWGRDCGAIINRKPSTEAGWDDTTGWTRGAE
jgi:hypothetical protein